MILAGLIWVVSSGLTDMAPFSWYVIGVWLFINGLTHIEWVTGATGDSCVTCLQHVARKPRLLDIVAENQVKTARESEFQCIITFQVFACVIFFFILTGQ